MPSLEKSLKTAREKTAALTPSSVCPDKNSGPRGWQSLLHEGTKRKPA